MKDCIVGPGVAHVMDGGVCRVCGYKEATPCRKK